MLWERGKMEDSGALSMLKLAATSVMGLKAGQKLRFGWKKDPVKSSRTPALNTQRASPLHNGPSHLSVSSSIPSSELKKLEAEVVERTEEAKALRQQKDEVVRTVEALTVILHHLTTTYEPFSTPHLREEVHRLNTHLTETRLGLDEASAALRQLREREVTTVERHSREVKELQDAHNKSIEDVTARHNAELDRVIEKHREELTRFAQDQETQRLDASRAHTTEVEQLEADWRTQLNIQHEKHLCALQDLNTRHTQQVRELESSHKAREKELEAAKYRLQHDHESLKAQSKKLEETLLNDTDHRLAAVRKLCTSLKSEVESLKCVVELKNTEIHSLRAQVVQVDRLTADLETARDRARSLQAKTEDLQAQMQQKAQQERSLVNENRLLVESYHRESNVNKRLSLENEELAWKLRHREEVLLSTSCPPAPAAAAASSASSMDLAPRTASPHCSTPQGTPRTPRIAPQARGTVSPCKSEPGRRVPRGTTNTGGEICMGGAPDSPPPSPCVKAVVEKSNSVSFILDLTQDASSLDVARLSPRRRPNRTASLSAADRPRLLHAHDDRSRLYAHTRTHNPSTRHAHTKVDVQRSSSVTLNERSSDRSREGSREGRNERSRDRNRDRSRDFSGEGRNEGSTERIIEGKSNSKQEMNEGMQRQETREGRNEGRNEGRGGERNDGSLERGIERSERQNDQESRERKNESSNRGDESSSSSREGSKDRTQGSKHSESQCYQLDDSDCSEVSEDSRTSPTGLSWTVPVRGGVRGCVGGVVGGAAPSRTSPRHPLQNPEEDEYECLPESPASQFLSPEPILSSSEPASDSEVSQCSDSDTGENKPRSRSRAVVRLPLDGAGEAMIPGDLLTHYRVNVRNIPTTIPMIPAAATSHAFRHRLPSAPSTDSEDNTTPHNNEEEEEDEVVCEVSWSEDVDVTSSSELHED